MMKLSHRSVSTNKRYTLTARPSGLSSGSHPMVVKWLMTSTGLAALTGSLASMKSSLAWVGSAVVNQKTGNGTAFWC
jgi:hypothetical protein